MTLSEHTEIERKYDADACLALPTLEGLPGVARVDGPEEQHLQAVYFDTTDLRLLRRQMTLRRREGGPDEGWHLKRPTRSGERRELRVPLDASPEGVVPPELVAETTAVTRGARLEPVVRMSTHRLVHHLYGAADGEDAQELAQVVEDEVVAETLGPAGGRTSSWSEIEVELVDGDLMVLGAVGDRLTAAGAVPAQSASKVGRVLASRLPHVRQAPSRARLTPDNPAGDVLAQHLVEQVRRLVENDPGARRDAPDAVHQMRVACRRLRSALGTFAALLDAEDTVPVREELRWLGEQLSAVRDTEVIRERLRQALAAQPVDLVVGPVARRLELELDARYRTAFGHMLTTLDEPRYFALLDRLEALALTPPWTPIAADPTRRALPPRVSHAVQQVRHRASRAEAAPDPSARTLALHEVRKAAKQARYAAEAVAPVFGDPARELAAAMAAVQDVLGEHQDTVVSRRLLRELAIAAYSSGEDTFTWGRLHALEEARAEQLRLAAGPVVAAAVRKRLRRWLP